MSDSNPRAGRIRASEELSLRATSKVIGPTSQLGPSGRNSNLRIENFRSSGTRQLLMEVKIGVCQRGGGMLELNMSRDGEVLVPGAQEDYENAFREEA